MTFGKVSVRQAGPWKAVRRGSKFQRTPQKLHVRAAAALAKGHWLGAALRRPLGPGLEAGCLFQNIFRSIARTDPGDVYGL